MRVTALCLLWLALGWLVRHQCDRPSERPNMAEVWATLVECVETIGECRRMVGSNR
jgi:hypothetical protein